MTRLIGIYSLLLVFAGLTVTTGCKKDLLKSDGALTFSVDTLVFDTVFTTVGSATRRFKVYNPSSRPVEVTSARLVGGENSNFRINLDGESGKEFSNIRIEGNDSLFLFAEVTLDPNNQNLPMIVEDSVEFITNGVSQRVILAAWGQDAYFHFNDINEGVWPNDKPHVIYNFAMVDSATSLVIQEGTKVHLHNQSLLYVRKGQLSIEGTVSNKVYFQGDRLEPFYDDVKGQYYGIYFEEAISSEINHAVIKNGTAGIHVFSTNQNNTDYTVRVTNSEIYNHSSYGLFNYDGASIYGENLLVHNNDLHQFFQLEGGAYEFRHCHLLGYGTDGSQPAIAIRNYFTRNDGNTYVGSIAQGNIYNSVIYGSGENQVAYDTIKPDGSVVVEYEFGNNLIRQNLEDFEYDENANFIDCIFNEDPLFENIEENIFKYPSNSVLNGNGSSNYAIPQDILENTRSMTTPDIGAYEL